MTTSHQNGWRELAVREGDGLEITLHWSTSADRVKVSVLDRRNDESFDIHVTGADALSAFHHPFTYAAEQYVCFSGALYEALDLQPQY